MPVYEYHCADCDEKVEILFLSFAAAEKGDAKCPECDSSKLTRLMSGFGSPAGSGSGESSPGKLPTKISEDPRQLAKIMHQHGGKKTGDDFKEVASRLEKGESARSVEASMRKRVGEKIEDVH